MFFLWYSDSWEMLHEITVCSELGCNNKEKKNKFCPLLKLINFTGSVSESNMGVPLDEAVWTSSNAATNGQSMGHSNSKAKQKCCSLLQ